MYKIIERFSSLVLLNHYRNHLLSHLRDKSFAILLFSFLFLTACGGSKNKDVTLEVAHITRDTALLIKVTDPAGRPVKNAIVEIISDEADIIPNGSGSKKTTNEQLGAVGFIVNKFSSEKEKIRIKASCKGYFSNSLFVTVYNKKANVETIIITKSGDNSVPGIQSTKHVGDTAQASIAIKLNEDKHYAQLIIPQNPGATTADGTPLSNILTTEIAQYNASDANALAAFPGGFSVTIENPRTVRRSKIIATDRTPITNGEIIFQSVGFTAIEIKDDQGNEAKNFKKPLTVTTDIFDGAYNPNTKKAIQAGDIVPIWSYDTDTGKWRYDQRGVVTKNAQGSLKIDYSVSHLSYWNLDFYSVDKCTATLNFKTQGANAQPLIGTLNGNGWTETFEYEGDGQITLDNAPGSFDVTLSLKTLSGAIVNPSPSIFNLCNPDTHEIEITPPATPLYRLNVKVVSYCSNDLSVDEAPVSGAHVNVTPSAKSEQTDVAGLANFELPAGSYSVSTNGAAKLVSESITITHGQEDVKLRIPQTCVVAPTNNAPKADAQSVTTDKNKSIAITLTGSDVDDDALSYTITRSPENGTLSGNAPNLIYTPNNNFTGDDTFDFTVNDTKLDSNTATVLIAVKASSIVVPSNILPTVNAGVDQTIAEGDSVDLIATASDTDGTIVSQEWSKQGVVVGDSLSLSLNNLAVGSHTLTITVTDNDGAKASDSLVVMVKGKNNSPPIADDQAVITQEDVEVSIMLSGSDVDLDSLTFLVSTNPAHGVLSGSAPDLKYKPNTNFHGTDSFTFYTNDGKLDSVSATVSVSVVADAPPITSESTDFWLTFNKNIDRPNKTRENLLYITSRYDTSVSVEIPGLNKTNTYQVSANSVTTVDLSIESKQLENYKLGKKNGGFHVLSDDPIVVYLINKIPESTDATSVIPTKALGNSYSLASYDISADKPGSEASFGSNFSVVATENNTVVSFKIGEDISNDGTQYLKGEVVKVNLDRGQTFQLQLPSSKDLTGRVVTSTKPVALFSGNECSHVAVVGACDHLVEQLSPIESLGAEFYTVPLAEREKGDTFRFIATEDKTIIQVNGKYVSELSAGEYFSTKLEEPSHIKASKPIQVMQYSNSTSYDSVTSDPFMLTVPPQEMYVNDYILTTPVRGFKSNYLNIISLASNINTIKVDEKAIDLSLWESIGQTDYMGIKIPVSLGAHKVKSNNPVGVYAYGYDSFDSYGYSGGMAFPSHENSSKLSLRTVPAQAVTGDKVCIQATILNSGNQPIVQKQVRYLLENEQLGLSIDTLDLTDIKGVSEYCYKRGISTIDNVTVKVGNLTELLSVNWINYTGNQNIAPIIESKPNMFTPLVGAYKYKVVATDANNDQLTYSLTDSPNEMTINPQTGVIQWDIPNPDSFLQTDVTIQVQDAKGKKTTQEYRLSSDPAYNHKPFINKQPKKEIIAGDNYTEDWNKLIHDVDGDEIKLTVLNAPVGFSINTIDNIANWQPSKDDAGTHNITVKLADARGAIRLFSYELIVLSNHAPVFSSTPPTQATVDQEYRYEIYATDVENDLISYEIISGPSGMYYTNAVMGPPDPFGFPEPKVDRLEWYPNTHQAGEHQVVIKASDHSSSTTQSFKIVVIDPNNLDITPPVITLIGDNPATILLGAQYSELGATVTDDRDSNLIATPTHTIDINKLGQYVVTYNATDSAGNIGTTQRVVIVKRPGGNQAPIAKAGEDIQISESQIATLDGSKSTDTDGTITRYEWKENNIILSTKISFTKSDWTVGSHTLKLSVTDNEGLAAFDEITVTVNEEEDKTPPVITIKSGDVTIEQGKTYIDAGATAVDNRDGSIEVVTTGTVNTSVVGSYIITYTAIDKAANKATATRTISVTLPLDTLPPVITVKGGDETIKLDSTYLDKGATAIDDRDSSINVVTTGVVNTRLVGTYTISYAATDKAGNTSLASRKVTVAVNEYGMKVCPVTQINNDTNFTDTYPEEDIDWVGANYINVNEIEKAFNNARLIDNSVSQYLKLPAQSVWDAMSVQQQGLYLINSERQARSIKPFDGVSPNVSTVAQNYSDYIRANNQILGHRNDGKSPIERLDQDTSIQNNRDFEVYSESIFAGFGTRALPTDTEIVVRAIYNWIYADKFPNIGSAWGHRDHLIQKGLNENSGVSYKEGLIGFGISKGDYDPSNAQLGYVGYVITLNSFDPSGSWDHALTQRVNTDEAQLCDNHVVIDVDDSIAPVDQLTSLEITSSDIYLTPGSSEQLIVIGNYKDGSQLDLTNAVSFTSNARSIVEINTGTVIALKHGSVYVSARANGLTSNSVFIRVDEKTDTSNLNGTSAEDYRQYIPDNATITKYDPKAISLFTGIVKDRFGMPLSDVSLSVHNQPEYGSAKTDNEGHFVLAAEAGTRRLVYQKAGYLTVHREKNSASNGWTIFNEVIMIAVDTKQTQITLGGAVPQTHISTVVTDKFGSRSTTLVFNGINTATVKSIDGSTRSLDSFSVRATEYELPKSMPAELPVESAFTYCSDLQILNVRDDETVVFDKPVVMYVDNFLNFKVGEIVPIGYYDRNIGVWEASDNGIVVKLLDANNDGKIDGLDYSGDDIADDINGNGITTDEVVGIENYLAGQTYWRGSFNHFTPWDFNWPYLPPADAMSPVDFKPDVPKECVAGGEQVETGSYVTPQNGAFHEDIEITGTNLSLHYSSERTEGYKHKIKIQVSGGSVPSSLIEMIIRLDVGGKLYEKVLAPQVNKNTEFIWDGKDASGNRVKGVVRGYISIGYKYQAQYSSAGRITTPEEFANFETAWAKLGSNTTGITGRDDFISWNNSVINIQNTYKAQIADGWTLSNHHESSPIGSIYTGNGRKIDGDKASLILKTGIQTSQYTGDDGYYQKGGSDIDYAINSNGALEDKVTGLEWQYSFPYVNHRSRIWAADYCDVIARDTGQAGWRLPTLKEVVYTIDKSAGNHDFPIYTFDALGYWTQQTVNQDGRLIPLICVKGDELDTSYIADLVRNDTDEVVADGQNGLMWQDDISATNNTFDWIGSIEYCENLDHAGFLNWRLPNINELTYALPNTTFVNQTTLPAGENWSPTVSFRKPYWSSTSNFNNSDQAWAMESVGYSDYVFSKSDNNYVRCVRDNIQSVRSPYRFDDKRRHEKTVDLNTGITLTSFKYDAEDRLISMTDRFGDTITLDRDINTGNVTSITTQDGYVTKLTIDDYNDLTQVDYPDGSNYQFIYDGKSLLTDKITPNGNTFLHMFDSNGRVLQTSDPEGGVWDFFSNLTTTGSTLYGYATVENNSYQTIRSILENGDIQKVTTNIYGTELTSIIQADDLKEAFQSCSVDTVIDNVLDSKTKKKIPSKITMTLPSGLVSITSIIKSYAENGADTTKQTLTITQNGKTSTVYSDSKTGVRTITSAEGRTSTLTTDPETLLLQSTQTPGLLDTTYGYDTRGRQTTVTTGDRTTTYTYDDTVSKGNVTTIVAADGKVTGFEYDEMGRVERVNYPDGHSTQNSYDDNGNLTTLVIPTPATHSFTHNSIDNVTSETTPLNETTQYSYDRDRSLTQITLPSGSVINNTNSNGLLTRSATPEGNIDYTYECGAKVSTVTEGSESLSYVYDGNLLTSFTYQGVLDATISQSYDTDFRITTLNYAGQATGLSYDDDGLVTGINGYTIIRNAQNGLPESVSNGTRTESRSYNGYGEAIAINTTINNRSIYGYELMYNNLGKITGKNETLDDGTVNNYSYGYDDKRQLVDVTLNDIEVERYNYDANGNRTNQSNTQRNISNQSATYNLGDQLLSNGGNTYEYDADGYLSKKITATGTTIYQYSSQGRLLQVQTPTDTINYQHNALGNRVAKSVNGAVVEKYLWLDKTTLLATYDGSDNLFQRFEYADGNTPTSFTQGGQTFYIVTGHLGSPRAITNNSGLVLKKISYDSFGNVLSDSNPAISIPFGFAGGLQDSDTGLVRFGFRDYDPENGRWTARDPIGFAGGDSNLYGYVFSDPINFIDQDGLLPSLPQGLVDAAAGFGDAISFGLTDWIRDKIDVNTSVNKCSSSYNAGTYAGTGLGLVTGGGIARAAYQTPKTLYHFTTKEATKSIRKKGLTVGTNNLYGKGVYATRYNSKILAKIQGAASTKAKVTITNTKGFKPTIFPGTFKTKGTNVPSSSLR